MIQNVTLFSVECEEYYYSLKHQFQMAPDRQARNPQFNPYQDVLKEYIPKILNIIVVTYKNWHTIKSGWKELARASKASTSVIKITVLTAARHAGVSSLVTGAESDARRLAILTFKDFFNPHLSWKEFKERRVCTATSAFGSTIMGAIGAATGAAIGTMIDPGIGRVVGTIMGNTVGGTVGAKLSHCVRQRMAKK